MVQFPARVRRSSLLKSIQFWGTHSLFPKWVKRGAFPGEKEAGGKGVKLTTYLNILPRLRTPQ
jgi:hypothetical protein